jgi:DNA-binding PadR family transcriptional regulator
MLVSKLGSGDFTPRMMVLGLVIQQEDTVAGVARRMNDQFPAARWPRGSAYKNVPSLASEGFLRLVEKGPPNEPTLDRYAGTPEGVELLHGWLRSTELPPGVRDVVQCKLEFVEEEDLLAFIQIVNDEEQAYTFAYDIAHTRVRREQRSRLARGLPVGWRIRLRGIQNKDEARLWSLMSKRLGRLREELEELLGEISNGSVDGGG